MTLNDKTTHERTVFATFTETDLIAILTKKMAADTGFVINPRETAIKIRFDKLDSAMGYKNAVEITMTNKLGGE